MKKVINWKTMSKIGVRFGSALTSVDSGRDIQSTPRGLARRLDGRWDSRPFAATGMRKVPQKLVCREHHRIRKCKSLGCGRGRRSKSPAPTTPTPSNVSNSASDMRRRRRWISIARRSVQSHQSGNHSLERSQQADHRPQCAEHGQHADLLFHLGGNGLADALDSFASLGQPVGQFRNARRQ